MMKIYNTVEELMKYFCFNLINHNLKIETELTQQYEYCRTVLTHTHKKL